MESKGYFCVSLDFELFWGMHDFNTIEHYGSHILKGKSMIDAQLELFKQYDIHATWGVVGLLLAQNREQAKEYAPQLKPSYDIEKRSSYPVLDGMTSEQEEYFFAPQKAKLIKDTPNQELGTHTFSHYYCTERGQNAEQFYADAEAEKKIFGLVGDEPKSILFPRNQCSKEYLKAAKRAGLECFRSRESNWIYKLIKSNFARRALRTIDSYLPLTGSNAHPLSQQEGLVNVAASAFLRPYDKKRFALEGLKIIRIKGQMKAAAKKKLVYHLYWHPHNLGGHSEKCFNQQRKIFPYYQKLNKKYGMESKNMIELCSIYRERTWKD